MEQEKAGVPAYFVYAGRTSASQHLYYVLTDLKFNDGQTVARHELETFHTSKKIFARNRIGYITPVTLTNEGKTVSYKKDTRVAGYWETEADLVEWRINDSAAETVATIEKKANANQLEKTLEPIRLQYARAHDKKTRAAILAEVIRIITS